MHFTAPGHTAILSLCDGENTGCLRVLCSLADEISSPQRLLKPSV